MSNVVLTKSNPKWDEFETLINQFYGLVKIPNPEDKENFLVVLKKINPKRIQQNVDLVFDINFENKFNREIIQPTHRFLTDFGIHKGKDKSDKDFENLLVRLEDDVLEKIEIFIDNFYDLLNDPKRILIWEDPNNEVKSTTDESPIYNNFKNPYNDFVNGYKKFLNKYKINRIFKPNYLIEYDEIAETGSECRLINLLNRLE